MKDKTIRLTLMCIAALAMTACSTSRSPAPIVDRTPPRTESKPAVVSSGPRHMDSHGYYTVRKGDTLHQIALEFGQNYRDLVAWNNLANANDIRVDQVIRVAPPGAAASSPNTTQTASVSGTPGIEVRPLSSPPSSAALASTSHKTAPRGDKLPYSESNLAELQKPESAVLASVKPETRGTEKPAESAPANTEDTGISWRWPTEGKVIAGFSEARKGIDIGGKAGQPVLAASGGKVMFAGSGIRGYGNLVIVKHTNTLLSAYAHNKTILVKEGQTVNQGDKIAEMGNTDSDAVKLHFEIRQQGKPVDPSKFLPDR